MTPAEPEGSTLDELYRRHAAAAVRLAYLLLQDRSAAEDIVQDAFVRLAGAWSTSVIRARSTRT